ncbi:MAG TPA: pyridoxamine 5'-phosphate oxidase [Thermoanaerobaculia bacterium]|nr:pyridoxamine 5'-phosphate oxidase [Thermoanaerobaculia bacterium]
MDVSGVRRDYKRAALDEREAAPDPITQFRAWLAEALAADPLDPTAMTLATADREGQPSARVVLLKGYDERGFVFFTNYGSRKACELLANPRAALVFYWPAFDRQVRAEGTVARTSRDETAAYFATRPLASQLSAWASRQSAPVAGREALERALAAAAEKFAGREVPAPEFWGGYRLSPTRMEFWQGRESRLHDRLVYRRDAAGAWTIERLQP